MLTGRAHSTEKSGAGDGKPPLTPPTIALPKRGTICGIGEQFAFAGLAAELSLVRSTDISYAERPVAPNLLAATPSRQIGDTVGYRSARYHLAGHVYLRRGQFPLALTTAEAADQINPPDQQAPVWLLRARVCQLTREREREH